MGGGAAEDSGAVRQRPVGMPYEEVKHHLVQRSPWLELWHLDTANIQIVVKVSGQPQIKI